MRLAAIKKAATRIARVLGCSYDQACLIAAILGTGVDEPRHRGRPEDDDSDDD